VHLMKRPDIARPAAALPACVLLLATALGACGASGNADEPKKTTPTSAKPTSTAAADGTCPDELPALGKGAADAAAGNVKAVTLLLCTYDEHGHQVNTYQDPGLSPQDAASGVISYAEGTVSRLAEGGKAGDICPTVMGPSWLIKITDGGTGARQWRADAGGCSSTVEVGPDFINPVKGAVTRTMSDPLLYDLIQQIPGAHDHDHGGDHDHEAELTQ
jgi:hypothetical protein